MVSTCPLILKSSSPRTYPLGISQVLHQQVVSPSPSCSIYIFLVQERGLGTYISFCFLLLSLCRLLGRQSPIFSWFYFFCWLSLGLVVWPIFGDPFVHQNPREIYAFHFPRRIICCAYTTYLYGYMKTFWSTPSRLSYPLVLYSFLRFLLHSLIMGLIVSLSALILLFCCVSSIFALT